MKVIVASCTKRKLDRRAKARELYDPSPYFRKQREYALAVGCDWFIQSAKYGLVYPDKEIEPYDVRADQLDDPDAWGDEIAEHLDGLMGAITGGPKATIEILGGSAYADPLTPSLEVLGYEVHEPLRGLGIGDRMQRLERMANQTLEAFA